MPTPSEEPVCPPALSEDLLVRAGHTTCPPEEARDASADSNRPRSLANTHISVAGASILVDPRHSIMTPSQQLSHRDDSYSDNLHDTQSSDPLDPSDTANKLSSSRSSPPLPQGAPPLPSPPLCSDISDSRSLPRYTSSFLRSGSIFKGTQQSDHQKYNVTVEVKHVDMNESVMCGFLTIQGLTQDHPTLTTYFEGEIIGTKYSFQTRRPEWGSSDKVDMQHWNRFPAWKPLVREARRSTFNYKDFAGREDIFMRWKEYFLVPDHRVRTISGASFEGFYYICFNQRRGTVSGIYFHSKSEKFQQLELKHVNDRGCTGAVEFR